MTEKKECFVAALDLGSQTFRLVIAKCCNNSCEIVASGRENVRLFQGMGRGRELTKEAIDRGIRALKNFRKQMDEHHVQRFSAISTEVLRRAANSHHFLKLAEEQAHIPIQIVPWDREAALAAKGALESIKPNQTLTGISAIIDVGGGSSEIIITRHTQPLAAVSIPVGAVSLSEELQLSDRLSATQVQEMEKFLSNLLKESAETALINQLKAHSLVSPDQPSLHSLKIDQVIATGGTATTAAAVMHEMTCYDPEKIRGKTLTTDQLKRLMEEIGSIPLGKRYEIPGLEPQRADIFPAGLAILRAIALILGIHQVVISDGGILLGLLLETIEKECKTHAQPSCARRLYI